MASLFSLRGKIFYSLPTLLKVSNSFLFLGRPPAGGSEGVGEGGRGGSEGGIGESDGSDVGLIGAFPSRPGAMLPLQRIER